MSQPMRAALTAISSYVPRGRLTAGRATGLSGVDGDVPPRAVAAHDEDTVSMAVEAVRGLPAEPRPAARLVLATSRPPYERTTNAAFVHAAARFEPDLAVCGDVTGGESAAYAAMERCADGGGVAVLSDTVVGRPGSAQESQGADAAVALRFGAGEDRVLATILDARCSPSTDLLTWRIPGSPADHVWRGRYPAHSLRAVATRVAGQLVDGGPADAPDVVAVSCHDPRLAAAVARQVGGQPVVDAETPVGYAGVAHVGLVLEHALRVAAPGDRILVLSVGDGASGLLLERGYADLPERAVASGTRDVPYTEYLSWRGLLVRDLSGRPDPAPPSIPAVARDPAWKFGLVGSRCTACGTVHVPPGRVCLRCGAVDATEPHELAHLPATIATFTVDHLAWGIRKPVCSAVVDFEGGGRFECEVTDAAPDELEVGATVRMVFRRAVQGEAIHNYVWKATLLREDDR